jgi:hypothetical protein
MKRTGAVLIAVIAGLGLMPGLAPLQAYAQSADLVLCDRVAAAPDDPGKPKDIAGVPTIAPSDIAIAIKYCRVASSRRAMYELDRACRIAFREGFAKPGQRIITVAGVPFGTPGATNMLRIAYVGAEPEAD